MKIKPTDQNTIERAARWVMRCGRTQPEQSAKFDICNWLDINNAEAMSSFSFSRFVLLVDREVAAMRREAQ